MTEAFSTTAGDVDALVERLLHRWRTRKVWEEQNGKLVRVDDALDEEAAEALTSLCTERDDWRAAHAETVATWDESKDNWSHSLKDAEARALKAEAENTWRPIESAPKDGTRIAILLESKPYVVAGSWLTHPGKRQERVTHWMPLPPPRSESQ